MIYCSELAVAAGVSIFTKVACGAQVVCRTGQTLHKCTFYFGRAHRRMTWNHNCDVFTIPIIVLCLAVERENDGASRMSGVARTTVSSDKNHV